VIRLDHLTKVFDTAQGPVTAADHVSLDLPEGEICVLLGPSGCGKTTTMKMINRLLQPTSGKIYIANQDTDGIDPIRLRRTIGYVIQQIGLFPNKTVAENICVVPDLLGWDRKKSRRRAAELLELVALEPAVFLDRYPRELSGGQQQRIGVIRALAADPPVMLMDEPFGAIDPINREVIQDEFLRMQQTLKKTIMFVSHDLDEAVKMADKIAIFNKGRLEQYGSPNHILAAPANDFVREFLGSDRALKRLTLIRVGDAMRRDVQGVHPDEPLSRALELLEASGDEAVLVIGPAGRPQGLLRRRVAKGARGHVGDHSEPLAETVRPDVDLRNAVALMFAHDLPILPCVDADGLLQGLLTYASVTQRLKIEKAPPL
jgi:osmoprotectant transport system ATP-binding protein